jgi:hypothetical protein
VSTIDGRGGQQMLEINVHDYFRFGYDYSLLRSHQLGIEDGS